MRPRGRPSVRAGRDHHVLRVLLRLGRELRRALGDQAVALSDQRAARGEPAGDDDLAIRAERVGDLAAVADGDRGAPVPGAVLDAEVEPGAAAMDRAGHDDAGQVVGLPGLRIDELRRLLRLVRGVERGVDEASGEQHGGAERHNQTDLPLAVGIHRGAADYRRAKFALERLTCRAMTGPGATPRRASIVAVALAALVAVAAPAPAAASCGGRVSGKPTKRVNPKGRA